MTEMSADFFLPTSVTNVDELQFPPPQRPPDDMAELR